MSSDRLSTVRNLEALSDGVARRDPSAYPVDGVLPAVALAPATVEEVSACLAAADEAGLAVVPWGGGSHMALGNHVSAYDVALDLRALNAVVQHEPDDLTIAVQAGCTVAALDRHLANHGQILPIDVAQPERATIGGLLATGLAGPRRFGYGALRDLLIGITVVLPRGTVARGGGMVVKNVSGFDMMRLYYGSLGSLAVITQANFKVIPRPRAQRTVLARFSSLAAAARAAEAVRMSQLAPTAIVAVNEAAARQADLPAAAWSVGLRCEAPPVAVARQAERIAEAIGAEAAATEVIDHDGTEPLWQRINLALDAAPAEQTIGVRVGAAPSQLVTVAEAMIASLTALDLEPALTLDFGSGLAYVRTAGDPGVLLRAWDELARLGAHATLLTAPAAIKRSTEVFGREPQGFATMRALKAEFDPRGTLNRGRFIGNL
ncbi:MAG: FAD-binding oxidoreductase [Sphaerobacter sp.]|nr:FAD-binding oxidoreductase [Sphaerobacter sp.]